METPKSIEKIKIIFEHVSIDTFIKYYEVFKNNKNVRSNTNIFEAFDLNNEPWNNESRSTRATKGKSIFKNNLEIAALEYILKYANSNRLSDFTLRKANELYNNYINIELRNENNLIEDVKLINQFITISEETKTALIKIRFGQSKYRSALINYWQGCSITNIKNFDILISSHIKPFNICDTIEEKYDIYNGLLLTPNYDKLFDKFLISFNNLGQIIISKSISDFELNILGIDKFATIREEKLTKNHLIYFDYHNFWFYEYESKR